MGLPASDPAVTAGVTSVRRSGIPAVGNLYWGAHFCHFYEDESDLLDIVAPYFRAGLADNEFCLWVTCEGFEREDVIAELRGRIPDLDEHLALGRLEIVRAETWYLAQGRFDPDRVVVAWQDKLRKALAGGFDGIRVHGNEAWLSQKTWAAFTDYEAHLDAALAGKPMLILCTYPLGDTSGTEIFDIARTHQFSIARRHGESEVMEHSEAVGATARVQRLNWQLERLVAERTAELETANAALGESEALYRFLAENTTDVISLYDLHGTSVYVSPSVERVLGRMREDIFDGVHPDDLPHLERTWELVRQGRPQTCTTRLRHADASWRWMEASARQAVYRNAPHVLVVSRDVTERIGLEEQLHHAQKMEALGRLAGGVAHDFNNLLTAIFGYAALALGDLPPASPASESLNEIKAAAERARRLTRQLLAFSRRDVRQPQVIDLARVVGGLENMFRLLLREDVELRIESGAERLPVFSDPVQLEQVLVNLVSNASDATRSGGAIRIRYDLYEATAGSAGQPAYVRPGRYARLLVSDTGHGLSPEVAAQAFEPFFTTKPAGLGTGLGLSTVFGIVKQSGGYVWIESEEGKGTSLFVLLPLAPTQAEELEDPAGAAPRHSLAGVTVVVVEDEAFVRQFVGDVLRRQGAEVLAFADPDEALRTLEDERRTVDLLVTDVVMPGMTGPSLVAAARRLRPALKVVFMSGYVDDQDGLTAAAPSSAILEKPFGPIDLLERVASAVADDASESPKKARRRRR
jgi:PAS domain S-box-containing protein